MNRPALQAGVRAAVAVSAGFAIGRYVLDDDQFAVFAAFTAMALLAFADYGGPIRARLVATAATIAVALPLVALGTVASQSSWGGPLAVGAVAFVVAYSVVLGGYFAAGANAMILFVVLAAGIPAPEGALDSRLAGTAVGGALAAAATALLWPARPERDVRRKLARAASALGACLTAPDAEARLAGAREEVRGARAALGDASHRPAEPTAPQRALLRLVFDFDRLLGRIAGLVLRHRPPEAARDLLAMGAAGLSAASESLAGRRPEHDPDALQAEFAALVPRVRAALAAGAAPADPEGFAREVEDAAVAGEVAQAAVLAALDAEIAAGRRPRTRDPAVVELLDAGPLEVSLRRLRNNLTIRSVHFRNALRLAIALALALALVHALDLQHGFWVVLATLTVVRTTAATTGVTARDAVVGTAIGFAVSIVVILGAESESDLYAALLGLVIFGAVYAARVGGVLAGQAAFTVLVVVLFSLLAPSDWTLALVRVEDVATGAAVGVAIGLLAWPRGAVGQLPSAIAEVIARGAGEARCAGRRALGREDDGDPTALRAATLAAARRAEDDLAVALAERRSAGPPRDAWPALLAGAGAIWYSTAWVSGIPGAAAPPACCRALSEDLARRSDAVSAGYLAAAAALRDGRRPPPTRGAPDDDVAVRACVAGGPGGAAEGAALVRLLAVRHWVRELEAGIGRLSEGIEGVALPRVGRDGHAAQPGGDVGG